MNQLSKLLLLLLVVLLFSFRNTSNVFISKSGKVRFTSNAPLEIIYAESDKLSGVLDITNRTFAFEIYITSFEGFNGDLQKENFNENYLESEKFPKATFTGKIIEDLDYTKEGIHRIRAKGILSTHNVKMERIINGTLKINKNSIEISSEFSILLEDHNIKLPKIVNQKIAEIIDIKVNMILKPKV